MRETSPNNAIKSDARTSLGLWQMLGVKTGYRDMIISHRHKFIFLKTNKTAGTSIEIALSKFCGPDDIITPISPEDEETRKKLGYPGPQNYYLPISSYGIRDAISFLTKRKKKHFYNHISAKEVKALIGNQVWDSYYKFCFERNPWDRVASLYYFRCRSETRPTLSEFVESSIPLALKRRGYELYTINEHIAVDKVCLYENLSKELETIRKLVGIPEKLELPRAKSKFRKDKQSYRDVFGEEDKLKIAELFREEINHFGYEF